jgi:8-oxo-dGTP pyrophosphatase MutT (NUDIX family)
MPLSTLLKDLMATIQGANFCLTDDVVEQIIGIHDLMTSEGLGELSGEHALCNAKKGAEHDPIEYYRIVDSKGNDTAKRLREKPSLDCWLKGADDTLLVAHWLTHLLGLRHRSVHLFLGSSRSAEITYLQLRSFGLHGHGGKLDIPVGGHVSECEDITITLSRELKEELGLSLQRHLRGGSCKYIGDYEYLEIDKGGKYREIELRSVFSGTLLSSGEQAIRMRKGEVGGIMLIFKNELQRLLHAYPTLVAGGLSGSARFLFQNLGSELHETVL